MCDDRILQLSSFQKNKWFFQLFYYHMIFNLVELLRHGNISLHPLFVLFVFIFLVLHFISTFALQTVGSRSGLRLLVGP